jgi:acetolactate synthase regulatory subunit
MTIAADPSADLLCRVIGLFAQRDLAAPGLTVAIAGAQMTVTLELASVDSRAVAQLAEKIARCVGVAAVTIDGVPLAYLAPAALTPA